MYADLSGFTAMSDKLSVSGRLGSEELASAINSIFDPLLDIIFSYGGDVIKFGGDAVLALFKGKGHTRKAVDCGQALLAAIEPGFAIKTSAGKFPIRIHLGISRGKAFSMITGKRGSRYDHLFCGPDVSQAYAAADSAESGELFVTESCLNALPKSIGTKSGDYFWIKKSSGRARQARNKVVNRAFQATSGLKQFMISGFWDRCAGKGQSGIEGEHRPLTIMFLGIDGWYSNLNASKGDNRSDYHKINDYIVELYKITEKFGGNIVRLDISESGEKVLVLFGAPILRENAPADSLRAAIEILEFTEQQSKNLAIPVKVKIGINSGVSYVGDVGGSYRREYTAMGKDVNLAARLMAKAAWGEIIAGENTLDAAGDGFDAIETETCRLKGIKTPVVLTKVIGVKSAKTSIIGKTDLVGREKEIGELEEFVAETSKGNAGVIGITGEAGSGKSVLMERAHDDLKSSDVTVLKTACFEHMASVPLAPIGDILKESVGIAVGDDRADRKRKLVSALEKNDLREWEGLICRLAGYSIKPTPEISNLTESIKRERTFQIVFSLLVDYFRGCYGCIIIDDLHWSDATSFEFLSQYGNRLAPRHISLFMVSRTTESIPCLQEAIAIRLGSLDNSAGIKLFNSIAGKKLDSKFINEIVKSSGGNPFFLEEMAKAVKDLGIEYWTEKKGIPDSVERVITARIDRLDEMVKSTIRTASVIGRVFGLDELSDIFKPRNKVSKIPKYLDKSSKLDITPLQKTEPRAEYRFKHILTREVAYSGLSFKSRRSLHRALAEYYNKVRLINGVESELIGHHFENSDSPFKAVPYYLRAGQESSKSFSNSEAIHNLNKVVDLLGSGGYDNIVCRAHLGLGRVYRLIGEYDKSESHFRTVIDRNRPGRRWKSDALKELSELFRIKSEFDKAADVLSEIATSDPDNQNFAAIRQNALGDIARRKGDLDSALAHFSKGLRYSDEIDPGLHAQILNNMGISLWLLGRLDEAILMYNLAMNIYKRKRDLQGISKISNNTGIIFEQQGKLYAASEFYRQAAEIFEKIGDKRAQGYCYGNLATNFIVRGLSHIARSYIDQAIDLFESIGERSAYAMTIGNLSDWYHFVGDKESERRYADRALKLAADLGNEELVCEMKIRMGRLVGRANAAVLLDLLKRSNHDAVSGKWHDLELKSEYYLCEWEVIFGEDRDSGLLLDKLKKIKSMEPPPEILCGVDRLIGLVYYQNGKSDEARKAFRKAYKLAIKSDLVCDKLEILHLYWSFFPGSVRKLERKSKVLKDRIIEGLDDLTVAMLQKRLKRRHDLYLSKAIKAHDLPAKKGKIARLFHN